MEQSHKVVLFAAVGAGEAGAGGGAAVPAVVAGAGGVAGRRRRRAGRAGRAHRRRHTPRAESVTILYNTYIMFSMIFFNYDRRRLNSLIETDGCRASYVTLRV